MNKTSCLLGANFIAAILVSTLPQNAVAADEENGIEEIVVTAQKREQNLSDVAMSITALNENVLEQMSATNFLDYQGSVPGLGIDIRGPNGGQRGEFRLNIRGVSSFVGAETVGL